MKHLLRNLFTMFIALLLSSCGGGDSEVSSGGSSGFGGTGLTFVRGNIASVDGRTITSLDEDKHPVQIVSNLLISPVLAQAIDAGSLRVTGGGKTSGVDQNGRFELVNVAPAENLVLSFILNNETVATLPVGSVATGEIVTVTNVRLDTSTGSAESEQIDKEVTELPDDVSEDDNSEDDISEDENSEDVDDDDSDDISEDGESEDDDSSDDTM